MLRMYKTNKTLRQRRRPSFVHGLEFLENRRLLTATPELLATNSVGQGSELFVYQAIHNRLLFVADDDAHGQELWTTDGTEAGTVLLQDIAPGPNSSRATTSRELNGKLLVWADDGTHGLELWSTDGTASGTVMLKGFTPNERWHTGRHGSGHRPARVGQFAPARFDQRQRHAVLWVLLCLERGWSYRVMEERRKRGGDDSAFRRFASMAHERQRNRLLSWFHGRVGFRAVEERWNRRRNGDGEGDQS